MERDSNNSPSAPLRDEATSTDNRLIWAGLFLCMALFAKVPQLDLMVAARYFTPTQGFVHAQDPVVRALYDWTPVVGRTILAALAVFAAMAPWVARALRARHDAWGQQCAGPWRRAAIVAVLCGVLGPGLVIEVWFKNTVGRPRPVQVEQFGGDQVFHGAFEHGPNTDNHRSFVSSHAAAGFWLMSLGLTCAPVWRRRWLLIGLVTGGIIGAGRMLQGGHFFSDIIFSFYAVWVSCEIIVLLDRRWQQRAPS